ncbi:hypothetical protein IMCC3135_16945 [Granulosicoccus antarcticus IMCC3135]|uniref:Uncharacterized protein n=2 Tax=Granulosicoccus TaxID=437504 RepID=A0A2Z2NTU8_9GAMM|nr:hypothetical protein IMCC3135_16945 [Granulosicoccus antarcticus IMCC3135]
MFKKFVQITALLNFPIALVMMFPAINAPEPDTFVITVVLGAFMIFTGVALLWAVSDIRNRAPVVVWGGLVRYAGFVAVAYAGLLGFAPKIFVAIAAMDLVTATIYIFGSINVSGLSFWSLMLGRSRTEEQ